MSTTVAHTVSEENARVSSEGNHKRMESCALTGHVRPSCLVKKVKDKQRHFLALSFPDTWPSDRISISVLQESLRVQ